MALDTLREIKKAEEEAQETIQQARNQAAELLSAAKRQAQQDYDERCSAYRQQALEKIAAAQSEAEQQSRNYRQETQSLGQELKQRLLPQRQKAIEAVIRIITD